MINTKSMRKFMMDGFLDSVGFCSSQCILDLSVLPILSNVSGFQQVWIPETIRELSERSKTNNQAQSVLQGLIRRATKRKFNLNELTDALEMGRIGETKLAYLTRDNVDERTATLVRRYVRSRKYVIEFSPARDTLAEVVSELVAGSRRLKIPIIMGARRLLADARRAVDIYETSPWRIGNVHRIKKDYFEAHFPAARRAQAIRWAMAIALEIDIGVPLPQEPKSGLQAALLVVDP